MKALRWALPIAILGILVLAAPGFAATRYAYPDGLDLGDDVGADFNCQTGHPHCGFWTAVNYATDGDVVLLHGGNYDSVTHVTTAAAGTIQSVPGEYAKVPINGSNFLSVTQSGTTLRNFEIDGTATSYLVNVKNAAPIPTTILLDHMRINQVGAGQALIMNPTTTLADSLVTYSPPGSSGLAVYGEGTIKNSTIIAAPGPTLSRAVLHSCGIHPAGAAVYPLTITNSIIDARGTTGTIYDIEQGAPSGGCTVPTTVDYSNLQTQSGVSTIGANNVSAPASLDGAYQQIPGSSTIDKGVAAAVTAGETDLFGDPRLAGFAPDIGADEYYVPPAGGGGGAALDRTRPVVSGLKAKKKKGKLKTFDFTSTEAGSATLTFAKKQGKKFKKAGSQTKAVRAGKNSVKPKKLKRGSYKLTLTVRDAGSNLSAAKSLRFTVK